MAQAVCQLCQEAIGYEVAFYNDYHLGLVHRLCYLRTIAEGAQDNGEAENREKPKESQGQGAAEG
jgi:hypothetical protein